MTWLNAWQRQRQRERREQRDREAGEQFQQRLREALAREREREAAVSTPLGNGDADGITMYLSNSVSVLSVPGYRASQHIEGLTMLTSAVSYSSLPMIPDDSAPTNYLGQRIIAIRAGWIECEHCDVVQPAPLDGACCYCKCTVAGGPQVIRPDEPPRDVRLRDEEE